jgi:hypothetical protein
LAVITGGREYKLQSDFDNSETERCRGRFIKHPIPHLSLRLHTQLPPLDIVEDGEYLLRVYIATANEGDERFQKSEYPIRVSFSSLPIVIDLTPEELAYLQREIRGQGGFQSLLRRIQRNIVRDRLVLSIPDAERIIRYSSQYGEGGFQGRLRRIIQQAREQIGAW